MWLSRNIIMAEQRQVQRIFIIRHGERLDNVDYEWVMKAERPYDPPLTEDGTREALVAGGRFKDKVKTNLVCHINLLIEYLNRVQYLSI